MSACEKTGLGGSACRRGLVLRSREHDVACNDMATMAGDREFSVSSHKSRVTGLTGRIYHSNSNQATQ